MDDDLLADAGPEHRKLLVRSRALFVALWSLGAAIALGLFRWTLVEYFTVFLEPLVEVAVGIFCLVSLIWSVVHLLRKRRDGLTSAALPLAVNVATALITFLVPFTAITISLDFRMHLTARTEVAQDVLAGKYEDRVRSAGDREDLISLPGHPFYLSSGGGEIVRLRRESDTLILFFSFRGILSSFSGFVYSTDDLPPKNEDFGGSFVEIDRLRKNWFWVSSRN
jgi:hypothetical protein